MIEPGARVAGRYLLEDLVNDSGGAALWKATDEILARPVAIRTFAPGFPRTSEVVRAARSASRVPDSRLTQVFDADDRGALPYVVEEWIAGQPLTDLLAQGPRESEWATGLVGEAAEALAAASAAGLHHMCLTPRKLIWTAGGSVKITGVCVDAALRGTTAENPELADAVGLGRLLYAALTGLWPGGGEHGLRPAPIVNGAPCDPGQVRAGIPEAANDIVRRSAFQDGGRNGIPLRSPREVADALAALPRAIPLPASPPAASTSSVPPTAAAGAGGAASPSPRPSPAPRTGYRRSHNERRSMTPRIAVGAVGLLVLIAVVLGAWSLGSQWNDYGPAVSEEPEPEEESEPSEELEVLEPASADGFDPQGDGDEHGDRAGLAIDGDSGTQWSTQGYTSAQLGNLKDGVGLIVDMGDTVEIEEADLQLGDGNASYELLVGDDADLGALTSVHSDTGASGDVAITLDEPAEGRYVVVWFTELPSDGSKYRASIHDMELRGTP